MTALLKVESGTWKTKRGMRCSLLTAMFVRPFPDPLHPVAGHIALQHDVVFLFFLALSLSLSLSLSLLSVAPFGVVLRREMKTLEMRNANRR